MTDSLRDKIKFFDQLKSSQSDDEFDATEEEHRRRSRKFFDKEQGSGSDHDSAAPEIVDLTNSFEAQEIVEATPRRVASSPISLPSAKAKTIEATPNTALRNAGRRGGLLASSRNDRDVLVSDTPIPETARPLRTIQRSDTTPLLPSHRRLGLSKDQGTSPSVSMKKRKREAPLNMKPEKNQIFKGLLFHYIPDNDIAKVRKIRITKAMEYGAIWTRAAGMATHIVVDKNIPFEDISDIVGGAGDALQSPIVVNENYPIDCIQFRTVLNPDQRKYRLAGQPVPGKGEEPKPVVPPASEESARSLQLKPPQRDTRRWASATAQSTPASSEASQDGPAVEATMDTDSQTVDLRLSEVDAPASAAMNEVVLATPKDTRINAKESNNPRKVEAKKDELSDYITMMQDLKDLPLDPDEEDGHPNDEATEEPSSDEDESGSLGERAKKRISAGRGKTRAGRKNIAYEERFACNNAGTKDANAGNPNTRTIEVLQQMADYYERTNDQWRILAYRKAIGTLKRQSAKITTADEALELPNVGQRLADKIEEIVTTDRLRRLEYAQGDPMDEALQLFLGIYGVGTRQAQQWIAQGHRTLDDLRREGGPRLTANQRLGVEHYEDLNTRIPRAEVEELGAVVRRAARETDPAVEIIIGGSYRRGAETSGDVDVVITKAGTTVSGELRPFLDALVRRLEGSGFLVARLASPSLRDGDGGSKWHGCCVLPRTEMAMMKMDEGASSTDNRHRAPVWRRIDLLLVPESERGAALLYFTGNDIFNRSMRLLASRKGMRLNQRGLYRDVMRGPQRTKVTEGELVEGRDERRIFEVLGVTWREPHERWC